MQIKFIKFMLEVIMEAQSGWIGALEILAYDFDLT